MSENPWLKPYTHSTIVSRLVTWSAPNPSAALKSAPRGQNQAGPVAFSIFILTSHNLHALLISRAPYRSRPPKFSSRASKASQTQESGWAMNNLDRYMEYLVAGVFLCVGFTRILTYRRRPKPLGAQSASLPFGLPYGTLVAVGLFQIVAALALLTPLSFSPPIAPWAAAGLVL